MGMGKANETGLIRLIDARTVLVIVLCSGIASMFARSMATHLAYLCVMTAFLVLFGKGRQGLACVLVYGLAMGGLWLEVHHGILAFPSPLLLSMIYRMIPTMMSLYLLILIPSGKLTAGLRKLPMPAQMRLILVVMLRFAPTALLEFLEVRNAMRVRGFLGSLRKMLRSPMDTLEYALVPLIFRSLKVSDELSASAVVRGIEYPGHKESYYVSKFRGLDITCSGVALAACIVCCL